MERAAQAGKEGLVAGGFLAREVVQARGGSIGW